MSINLTDYAAGRPRAAFARRFRLPRGVVHITQEGFEIIQEAQRYAFSRPAQRREDCCDCGVRRDAHMRDNLADVQHESRGGAREPV